MPLASASETARVIDAAAAAFRRGATPRHRRAAILFRFKEPLDRHTDEIAQLIAAEHGTVLNDACGSLTRGIEVESACGAPHLPPRALFPRMSVPMSTAIRCGNWSAWVCRHHTIQSFRRWSRCGCFRWRSPCGNTFVPKTSERVPSTAAAPG